MSLLDLPEIGSRAGIVMEVWPCGIWNRLSDCRVAECMCLRSTVTPLHGHSPPACRADSNCRQSRVTCVNGDGDFLVTCTVDGTATVRSMARDDTFGTVLQVYSVGIGQCAHSDFRARDGHVRE